MFFFDSVVANFPLSSHRHSSALLVLIIICSITYLSVVM